MIRTILSRPVAIAIGASTLVALGLVSLARLPVSLLPALERPRLDGVVELPGLSRAEAIRRVTRPLERGLAAVPGTVRVETETSDERVRFRARTEWETDPDRFRIEVERRLAEVAAEGRVRVEMGSGDLEPVVDIAVLGLTGGARAAFVDRVLRPELASLPAAGRIEVLGASPRHVVVTPRWAELAARRLSVPDLVRALDGIGISASLGRVRVGGEVRPLVLRRDVDSLEAIRSLRVPGPLGLAPLGDFADLGIEEIPGRDAYRLEGRDGVLVRLFRAPGGNAVALAGEARRVVDRLNRSSDSGPELRIVRDGSREVVAALRELAAAAAAGFLLGTIFLRWMLGRWRPTLALALVVPVSVVGSFSAFFAWGLAIDLVALAGLALAAGLLVDNSIVVLESIESSREAGDPEPAVRGTSRVALPVIAGVLTTAVVFLPLVYLRGLARAFFGVQAFAIVAALLVSLLVSFTVTPALAGRGGGGSSGGRRPGLGACVGLLSRLLERPRVAAGLFLLLATAGLWALLGLRRELLPREPSRELEVAYRLPPHGSAEAARELGAAWSNRVAVALEGVSEGEATVEWRQEPDPETRLSGAEVDGRLILRFPSEEEAEAAERVLAGSALRSPEVRYEVRGRRGALLQAVEGLGGTIEVDALAGTRQEARDLARRAGERLADRGALVESGERPAEVPTWWVVPRPGEVAPTVLADDVRAASTPVEAGRVGWPGVEPGIRIEPAVGDPARIPIRGGDPLAARAKLEAGGRAGASLRLDGRTAERFRVSLPAGLDPLDLGRVLAEVPVSPGESLRAGGEAYELAKSFRQVGGTLALSLILVYLAVAALFESLRLAWVVLATVPVALAGAGGALLATGGTLNLVSFLGLVVLVGIVGNNAIVLVHRAEEEAGGGGSRREAIRIAVAERYRPIVLTTLTTISGLVPLALLGGEGVALRQALAVTIAGGLAAGLVGSLLLVPVLWAGLGRAGSRG